MYDTPSYVLLLLSIETDWSSASAPALITKLPTTVSFSIFLAEISETFNTFGSASYTGGSQVVSLTPSSQATSIL